MSIRTAFMFALGLVALPALADNLAAVALDKTYVAECGSCHVAYPPGLLNRADWGRVMGALDKHFGSDASLEPAERDAIFAYLEKHAGRRSAGQTGLPRITASRWFQREHREVAAPTWRDPAVRSPANCVACHKGAEAGRYGEHEIQVPGLPGRTGRERGEHHEREGD